MCIRDSIYICGAANQAGQLYLQVNGSFKKSGQKIFEDFKYFEDTEAVFFDADKDGDLDLYIGAGGNELDPKQRGLNDRLYANDGKGNFSLAANALPPNGMNTSVVIPMDYDKDGDLDLFVGSRSLPKTYGLSPVSYVFENLGNHKFKDSTPESFQTLGMIRDAAWDDINGDGNKELTVVGDWMNPMTFAYQNGAFTQIKTGLEDYQGFWGRIEAVDIDNDKDCLLYTSRCV